MKVLVADDSSTIRAVLKGQLRLLHVEEILEAGDGRQVLDLLERTAVDVILLDREMPNLDGIETLAALKERLGDAALPPIIMISAQDAREEASAAGARAFLTKPFTADALRAILTAVVPQFSAR